MKILPWAAATLTAVLVTGCETDPNGIHPPPPPTPTGPAGWPGQPQAQQAGSILRSPNGARIRYQDNHGTYTITLFPDGRYRHVSVSQNETLADTREGRWTWEPAANGRGELTLGDNTWTLRFVSQDRADAKTDGDVRTYRFSFDRL
jgi:hypothetical protein